MTAQFKTIIEDFEGALESAPPYGRVTYEVVFHDGRPTFANTQYSRSLALNAPAKKETAQYSRQGIRQQ